MARPEISRAALLFGLLAVLFLSPALLTGRYLSSVDMLLDSYPWREVRPGDWEGPSNNLLVDSAVQFEPWLAYSAKRLREGSLPLWNPNNMLGAPFLGNMQSGIFYPLNWPYFAWPDPWMLLVRGWLKLFIVALGMYVLVREVLKIGPLAAGVAAITFTFGAFMTVWLLHPHTATVIWLPWLWWGTARLVERPGARRAALLAVFVGLHMLAGHPETAYHMGQATTLFMLFHAWQTGPLNVKRLIRIFGWWAGAYLLGALVSAVQLLPFLEYSQMSMAMLRRTERQMTPFFVPFHYAWTAFSPDLFGNPALKMQWGAPINYNEANNYSGIFPLLLAPFALLLRDRAQKRLALFLAASILLALGVIHNWPGISDVALALPGMRLVLNNRLVMLVEFALALLAALGVHGLLSALPEQRRLFVWAFGGGVAALLLLGVLAPLFFAHSFFGVPTESELANRVWGEAIWRAGLLVLLCGGVLALIGILWKSSRRMSTVLWLIPLVLLADLWQAHITYLPTTRPEHYFPQTSTTDFLRGKEGPYRVSASQGILTPTTNMAYGLADLRGYDAVESQLYYQLAVRGDPSRKQLTTGGFNLSRALDLLNVRYIITAPGDDPNYAPDVRQEINTAPVGEIAGELRPGQDFIAQADNLAGIQVLGATYGKQAASRLIFTLKEGPAATLVTQELDASRLPDNSYWTITFPPISATQGRRFYFYFSAPEAQPGHAATLWYNQKDAYPGGTRREGDRAVGGDLVFRTLTAISSENPRFRRVLGGGFNSPGVYENRRVLPRAWLTYQVEVQPDAGERIKRLYDPTFYIAGTALLSQPLSASSVLPGSPVSESDSATITRYEPEYVEVKTVSSSASLLVLSDLAFPGWEAEVDGQPVPILTADHALRAVYLPVGEHTVKFVYRPLSFTLGAIVSLISLVVIGLLGWPLPFPNYELDGREINS
ncbi:MAG: YfhO family protein [Chloroflexia bacterium]